MTRSTPEADSPLLRTSLLAQSVFHLGIAQIALAPVGVRIDTRTLQLSPSIGRRSKGVRFRNTVTR